METPAAGPKLLSSSEKTSSIFPTMVSVFYCLQDKISAPCHLLAPKMGGRAVTRAQLICPIIFQGITEAERLQLSDTGKKDWLQTAKHLCYDLIDVVEELTLQLDKLPLGRWLSLFNLYLGFRKMNGIVNGLEALLLEIHGQDGEESDLAGLLFRLRDDLLNPEHEDLLRKVDTVMLRKALQKAVVVSFIIHNAASQQVSDQALKEKWVESAKGICKDLIEVFEELKQKAKNGRVLAHPLSLCKPHMGRHEMKGIIRELRASMKDAAIMRLRPVPIHEENPEGRTTPPTTSLAYEAKIHGRHKEERTLIRQLSHEAKDIKFISIVGKAGIGKSAMAKLVYNDPEVIKFFKRRAWVFDSEKFDESHILKAIINSLTSDPVNEVQSKPLDQIVRRQKCLFVLDNVQKKYGFSRCRCMWLKELFRHCAAGTKILITTRDKVVVRNGGSTPTDSGLSEEENIIDLSDLSEEENIIELSDLSEEACWSIIKGSPSGTPVDEKSQVGEIFNEVDRGIVNKCDGVPLIAKFLGGILRSKESKEWQEVLLSDVWDTEGRTYLWGIGGMAHLRPSLMLSYSVMPPELRQCLLYFSIFPKNHSIDVGKLIKLWIAQGFVNSDQGEMEREGWRSVKQLLDRSVFQEFKHDGNGNYKCKLEDRMRDFIQFLGEHEFIMLLDNEKEPGEKHPPPVPRHCTLNIASQTSLQKSIAYAAKLHTLIILSEYSSADPTKLASLLSHMRRLRALGLSSCSIKELPLKEGELLYLRFLDLSFNHELKELPEAICNLLNLQTLNLNGCDSLQELPKGIGKLKKLRHLEILWTTSLGYLPKGIASLTSLRTLSRFFGNLVLVEKHVNCASNKKRKACNLGDLENLNHLQGCITIDGLGGETDASDAAKAGLKNKEDLLGLELWFSTVGSESNDEGVLEALEAPPRLEGLGIFYYRGESFPDWMTALGRLTHLMLSDCSKCKTLPPLGKLPSLKSLQIKNMSSVKNVGSEFLGIGSNNADDGGESSSSTVAFPNLQNLCFQKLDDWEDWTGINGKGRHGNIMPSLSSLSIANCPELKDFPDYIIVYIKENTNLRLDIKKCPRLKIAQGINKNEKTTVHQTKKRKQV